MVIAVALPAAPPPFAASVSRVVAGDLGRSWRPGCPVAPSELRRVRVAYWGFDGDRRLGIVVVHRDAAAAVVTVFRRLYRSRFPIRSVRPVSAYGGSDDASMAADNTSAFNCRRPDQINAPVLSSPHANGRAIDINPRENPWKDTRCSCWSPGRAQAAREPGPGKILQGGLVWRRFRQEGWVWQNISVADYMHFDTGYPSRPVNDATVPITGAGNR